MSSDFQNTWKNLIKISRDKNSLDLQSLFLNDSERVKKMSFAMGSLFLDLSKNLWTDEIINHLLILAESRGLNQKIDDLFNSNIVNYSENKPATHTKYRANKTDTKIESYRNKFLNVAKKYRNGEWKTAFSKPVKYVVNIGIGGSYLGPKLVVDALTNLQTQNDIKVLYLSSIDDSLWQSVLSQIDIEHTLFCLSSKSLSTSETLINWEKVNLALQSNKSYTPTGTNQSVVIATANQQKAETLGIPASHILNFENSLGGRFSVWSSIGFPIVMANGVEGFKSFLKGAEEMDQHFQNTSFDKNLPVLLALLSVWNRNFLNLPTAIYAPYDQRLSNFPLWLQQLMMESNGKSLDVNSETTIIETSPTIFGDHGQLSQHAFFQSIHQGSDTLPIEFIGIKKTMIEQKELLINMLAQSSALMKGKKSLNSPESNCPGNRPSSILIIDELNAKSLGQLLAMYEHMVFTQSVIWNINCFDQPGVEIGKSIAKDVIQALKEDRISDLNLDPSTLNILNKIL